MRLNSLPEIVACINKWNDIRNDEEAVYNALQNVQSFSYSMNVDTVDNLHVYPGVSPTTGKFYIFLIPKEEDKSQSDTKLFDAIIQTTVHDYLGNADDIPEREAKLRISNWNKHRKDWISAQVNSEVGIFKAFNLPSSYILKDSQYCSFFALKSNIDVSSNYDADLITTDYPVRTIVEYRDFTRPVPPFGGSLTEAMFYLLQL